MFGTILVCRFWIQAGVSSVSGTMLIGKLQCLILSCCPFTVCRSHSTWRGNMLGVEVSEQGDLLPLI